MTIANSDSSVNGKADYDRFRDGCSYQNSTPPPYRVRLIDSREFAEADYRRDWLIRRHFVARQPRVLGAPKKSLKTTIVVEEAICLASGRPFLGEFEVPRVATVAVLSGESGEATLQETALRIARAKHLDLTELPIYWGFDLPQLSNPEHMDALKVAILRAKIEVLYYDPLYLGLLSGVGAEGLSASNLYQVGPLLLNVARTCLDAGCTPVLVHHFKLTRKDAYAEPQLDDLAFSGIQEFARQWTLLGRREPFDPDDEEGKHALWLSSGGSAGHSLLRAVNVHEGRLGEDFSGRTWRVEVLLPSAARADASEGRNATKERQQAAMNKADDAKVLSTLDKHDPDRLGLSITRLKGYSGISSDRTRRSCGRLLDEGVIEQLERSVPGGNGSTQRAECYCRPPLAGQEGTAPSEQPVAETKAKRQQRRARKQKRNGGNGRKNGGCTTVTTVPPSQVWQR